MALIHKPQVRGPEAARGTRAEQMVPEDVTSEERSFSRRRRLLAFHFSPWASTETSSEGPISR